MFCVYVKPYTPTQSQAIKYAKQIGVTPLRRDEIYVPLFSGDFFMKTLDVEDEYYDIKVGAPQRVDVIDDKLVVPFINDYLEERKDYFGTQLIEFSPYKRYTSYLPISYDTDVDYYQLPDIEFGINLFGERIKYINYFDYG